jgi:hypothetical protein
MIVAPDAGTSTLLTLIGVSLSVHLPSMLSLLHLLTGSIPCYMYRRAYITLDPLCICPHVMFPPSMALQSNMGGLDDEVISGLNNELGGGSKLSHSVPFCIESPCPIMY